MGKLKLLYCLETIGSGDSEKRVYDQASRLEKDHFIQKAVCINALGPLPDQMEAWGIEVIDIGRLNSPFNIYRVQMILQVIKSYKPHVINGIGPTGIKMARAAGKLGRVPVVVFGEDQDFHRLYQDLAGGNKPYQR